MNRRLFFLTIAFLVIPALYAVPSISQQPQTVATSAGRSASFSVVATGSGPLSYQWRRDGFNLPGGTASFFSIPVASQGDNGAYDVLVNDASQVIASDLAMLRVSPATDVGTLALDSTSARLEGPSQGRLVKPAVLRDGRFYLAGNIITAQDQPRFGIARFNADGSLDSSFVPPALNGEISSMAALPDGRLLIGGDFTTVEGVESRRLARLNLSGTLDRTFPVGVGFSGAPQVMVVAPDGSVFVSGSFSTYQGRSASRLIKLTPVAALDDGFISPNLGQPPTDLVLSPDGKLYVGGASHTQAGVTRTARILRVLSNGTIDPAFDAGSGAVNGTLDRILRQADGKLLLAGFFDNFNGSGIRRLVRVLEDGSVDPTFNLGLSTNSLPAALAQLPSGDLIIGGSLSGGFSTNLIRVRLNGTRDATFSPPAYGPVGDAALLPDGRLLVSGSRLISTGGGTQLFASAEILDSSGRKTAFDARLRFPASVRMMRHQAGGKLILAGDFTHFNGTPVGRVIRLNQDLTLDPTFRTGTGLNDAVITAALQPDGKILLIGFFTQMAGTPTTGFIRLNADGTLDPGFRASSAAVSAYPSPPVVLRDGRIVVPLSSPWAANGFEVHAPDGTLVPNPFGVGNTGELRMAASLPGGQVLFAGDFTTWNGANKPRLVRVNLDGRVDAGFTAPASALPFPSRFDVEGRAVQSTGKVVISARGNSPFLVRLLPDGQVDPTFILEPTPPPGYLILADDHILLWNGDGSSSSTLSLTAQVFRLLSDGRKDPGFLLAGEPRTDALGRPFWSVMALTDSGAIVAATGTGLLLRYVPTVRPVITAQPMAVTRPAGDSATFSVTAAGVAPFSYQWYFNGVAISGATTATLTLPKVFSVHAGDYHVVVTNENGATASTAATLSIDNATSALARLTNLSVRANLGSAPLITGFVVDGGGREMLLRGIGPGLGQFSITGAAADTQLALYSGATLVDQNDNWAGVTGLSDAIRAVGAFPVPASSLDAMLLRTVGGAHTAQLSARGSGGVALVEVYDANPAAVLTARLTNVSARYQVGTGDNILIAGFSIGGAGGKALLIRGVGPALAAFGVPNTLADPRLAVFSGVTAVAENNDWGGTAELSAAAAAVGAFPLAAASRDAALLLWLPVGSYTVQLSGNANGTGEGLIEIYEVP